VARDWVSLESRFRPLSTPTRSCTGPTSPQSSCSRTWPHTPASWSTTCPDNACSKPRSQPTDARR
ncbi:uncharacterized protein METZ01_LOCUS244190, partial [marine metagenome]